MHRSRLKKMRGSRSVSSSIGRTWRDKYLASSVAGLVAADQVNVNVRSRRRCCALDSPAQATTLAVESRFVAEDVEEDTCHPHTFGNDTVSNVGRLDLQEMSRPHSGRRRRTCPRPIPTSVLRQVEALTHDRLDGTRLSVVSHIWI